MTDSASTMTPQNLEELESYAVSVKESVLAKRESPKERFERYTASFMPSVEHLKVTTASFVDECTQGLDAHLKRQLSHHKEFQGADCSFKHLDSFVPCAPSGKESGIYYALDFGGSNFRVLRAEMKNGEVKMDAKKASLLDCETPFPKGLLDPKATARMMFDFFALICEQFMKENGDIRSPTAFPLGFTFSYPCVMRSLDSASLIVWTKGFETGRDTDDPVEGCDVAELMNAAFKRKSLPLRVNCVANDTVGTLLSCAYMLDNKAHPPCAVGLILGTGMNACYIEEYAPDWGYKGKIINIECGNFNRDLPRTNVDFELDFNDVGGRGRQHLEKMVSGAYLGEICRRAIVKVFQDKATSQMWTAQTFGSEDASTCIGDKSESLIVVDRKCKEKWQATFTQRELVWVREICVAVFNRAAALTATMIAACALATGRLRDAVGGVTVGVDGSLFKCNYFLQLDIRRYLNLILGEKQASLIHIVDAEDGSGLGAAILSAVAESRSSNSH